MTRPTPVFGRRTAQVAAALVAVSMLSACKEELLAKVDEADANAALDALYADGIAGRKTPVDGNLWRVEVDAGDLQGAVHATRRQGIPRERFASMGDLFKKEGLVATPSEVRMRYLFAVSQELSNTLSRIDGVISARVHPVIPVNDPLAEKVQPSSAAVFIKHQPDADIQQMAPAIRALVARSIEGLAVDHVSLTFFASRAPAPRTRATPAGSDPVVTALASLTAAFAAVVAAVLGWQRWRRVRPAGHGPLTSRGAAHP